MRDQKPLSHKNRLQPGGNIATPDQPRFAPFQTWWSIDIDGPRLCRRNYSEHCCKKGTETPAARPQLLVFLRVRLGLVSSRTGAISADRPDHRLASRNDRAGLPPLEFRLALFHERRAALAEILAVHALDPDLPDRVH